MRLVFMGSGSFAVPSLRALLASPAHDVAALVTQPDKPAGRGHRLRLPATKRVALEYGIDVHQPDRVRKPEGVELVRRLAPECVVVVAYGQIIPKAILEIPPRGIINVHASLLPRYRGAAPIQWAIANGEPETGVTTMLIDEGLDTGPILLQEATSLHGDETSAQLEPRLAVLGASLLIRTLEAWVSGALSPQPQDDTQATLAPLIKKEEGIIDWSSSATAISRRVRAFDPWPVAQTTLSGQPIKIWKARPIALEGPRAQNPTEPPGAVATIGPKGFDVACGEGNLAIEEVQPAGKPRMPAADFARGKRLRVGDVVGG
jgi:methionyl-tRNA formyltransferase